jgi:hypothetical protein
MMTTTQVQRHPSSPAWVVHAVRCCECNGFLNAEYFTGGKEMSFPIKVADHVIRQELIHGWFCAGQLEFA